MTAWLDRAVDPLGDGRFRAHVDESWVALQGVHGGIVAALALRAVEAVLTDEGVDPATTLRAATLGYVSGTQVGDITIDVEVVRRGRSMVTSHAAIRQDGATKVVARFHHSLPWEGAQFSDAATATPRPTDAVRVEWEAPRHITKVETYVDPAMRPFAGAPRAEWLAWSRPLEGPTFDASWLLMYGDFFPPAVFLRTAGPVRAVTVEYSMQIHSAAQCWTLGDSGLLAARFHALHSAQGFAVEDGWIHLPDGTLLATTRQSRLAG